jgi:hypothetical protein
MTTTTMRDGRRSWTAILDGDPGRRSWTAILDGDPIAAARTGAIA